MAASLQQKNYLITFEQTFNVSKPIFIDRNVATWQQYQHENNIDTPIWCINDDKLVYAKNLRNNNIVGRYKLNLQNSDVQELWFDVESNINPSSPIQVNENFKQLRTATMQVVKTLLNFGIPQNFIYVKTSGKGFHIHVYIKDLTEQQFKLLTEVLIDKTGLPNSKSHSLNNTDAVTFGLDLPSTTKTVMKLREYGGINEKLGQNHYCSHVDINKLAKMKTYPFTLNPKNVVYPNPQPYQLTPQQIQTVNTYKTTQQTQPLISKTAVNYNIIGDPNKLTQCPLVKQLIEKSKTITPQNRHNLSNTDRIFLSHLYTFFGQNGEQQLHNILSSCPDYNQQETQKQIVSLKNNNHKPVTCEWAQKEIGCPPCTLNCGRTPLNLARQKTSLQQVKQAYLKWFDFANEQNIVDTDIIDLTLAAVADRFIPGFEKVWLFLVARSGGIKTQILRGISKLPHTYTLDSLTSKTLISGIMEQTPYGRKAVGGIMQHLNEKTLVIKDFTLILSLNSEERNAIFSDLRNAYDGYLEKSYGTSDQKVTAQAHFGLVAACTPVIDNYWQLNNLMGDRFLKIRHEIDDRKASRKALTEEGKEAKAQTEIQQAVNNYFADLDLTREVTVPKWILDILLEAVDYTAHMRTALMTTNHTDGNNYSFAGSTEYPTRLAKQSKRLIKLLTLIRGKPEPTIHEVTTTLRVLIDTPPLYRSKLIPHLIQYGTLTQNKAAKLMHAHHDTADRVLRELYYVNILEPTDQSNLTYWHFTDHFNEIIQNLINSIAKGTKMSTQQATQLLLNLFLQQPKQVKATRKDRLNSSTIAKENQTLTAHLH